MPASLQGTQFRTDGDPILNLNPPVGVSPQQQRGQLDLMQRVNPQYAAASPGNSELQARIASFELAFRMQSHAPEAVDVSRESKTTHSLYGLDDPQTEKFGRRCRGDCGDGARNAGARPYAAAMMNLCRWMLPSDNERLNANNERV